MATDNEFLRLIYLALANSSGGTSGAGMLAAVRDGIDAATDINSILTKLDLLIAQDFGAILDSTVGVHASANYNWIVPAGEQWEIVSVAARLDTSAVAANRILRLNFYTASATISIPATAYITASQSRSYRFCDIGASLTSPDGITFTLPMPSGIVLSAGQTVQISSDNFQAGDGYSLLSLIYRKRLV